MAVLGVLKDAMTVWIHQECLEMEGSPQRSLGKLDVNLAQWLSWCVTPSNMEMTIN